MKTGHYKYSIDFRIDHPDADLSEVPTRLGLSSDYMWNKGDPRATRDGHIWSGPRRDSHCTIEFDRGTEEDGLASGLKVALFALAPHKTFLHELSTNGVNLSLFALVISDHMAREVLDWEILRDMAELRISLDLYYYADNDETYYSRKS